jgi:hypothetical protein
MADPYVLAAIVREVWLGQLPDGHRIVLDDDAPGRLWLLGPVPICAHTYVTFEDIDYDLGNRASINVALHAADERMAAALESHLAYGVADVVADV